MIVTSDNFRLKLEEILIDNLSTKGFNDIEENVLKLIREWYSGKTQFQHATSGSTGIPKNISISKAKIELSSRATMLFIDPNGKIKQTLLCLDPTHIGGAMVIYRALLFNHDIHIIEPSSHPLEKLDPNATFDLVSMVPLQFNSLAENEIERFKNVLVGGAPIEKKSFNGLTSKIYATFGMTETVSHIALRLINEDSFHTIGDNVVDVGSDGSLKIKGSITDNHWLKTNDIVNLTSSTSFLWLGRKDFIINSGGLKINPEKIEQTLSDQFEEDFIVSSLPDKRLGSKLILISKGSEMKVDFSKLDKYERPKSLFFNCTIFRTKGGKIDRIKTLNQLIRKI